MKKIKLFPIICAFFVISALLCFIKPVSRLSSLQKAQEKTVIIDAGHGGIDGGAVSKSGIVEKGINLEIAKMLETMLKEKGYNVIMTRSEDISIHDDDATTIRQKKSSDLHNRLEITTRNPNAIFVSIHQNIINDSTSCGAQIFYSPNNAESEKLASCLRDAFRANLQPDNKREIKTAGKNLFILYNAQIPAIMAECGFLSNVEEAELLNSPDYQKKVAQTLCAGIEEYYKKD